MNLVEITFSPTAHVEITLEELSVMIACAKAHYDSRCKEAAEVGGLLFGMGNRYDTEPSAVHPLSWRDLDLLSKILEVGGYLVGDQVEQARRLYHRLHHTAAFVSENIPAAIKTD